VTALDFGAVLLGVAQDALPWIAGGVGAALVLFSVWLGLRRALSFFVILAGMNEAAPGGNWGAAWAHSGNR